MKAGGVIKKAKGGFLEMKEKVPGKTYKGFPHSPTSKVDDAVSAHKKGGAVGKRAGGGGVPSSADAGAEDDGSGGGVAGGGLKRGGGVKKRQFGGGLGMTPGPVGAGGLGQGQAAVGPPGGSGLMGLFPGRQPIPAQQGPATVSGRSMIPPQPAQTAQMPRMASSVMARPAPGTTTTYSKKGGSVTKKKNGGGLSPYSDKQLYRNQGKGFADGGTVGGAGSGVRRLARNKAG
jgi:hypothetical protein